MTTPKWQEFPKDIPDVNEVVQLQATDEGGHALIMEVTISSRTQHPDGACFIFFAAILLSKTSGTPIAAQFHPDNKSWTLVAGKAGIFNDHTVTVIRRSC